MNNSLAGRLRVEQAICLVGLVEPPVMREEVVDVDTPVGDEARTIRLAIPVKSLPHMPDDLISRSTSPEPGLGFGKSRVFTLRSPARTTPFTRIPRLSCGRFGRIPRDRPDGMPPTPRPTASGRRRTMSLRPPRRGSRTRQPSRFEEYRARRPPDGGQPNVLSRARTTADTVLFTGVGIPNRAASRDTAPLITSISERRRAMWSSSMDGRACGIFSPKART